MSDTFTESDLTPPPWVQRAKRLALVDRAAATVAVLSAGLYIGGLIALGACAAPMVFRLTPAPFSGEAMGAAFARFDQIAIGASVVALAAEVCRTWVQGLKGRTVLSRLRRSCTIFMAICAAYVGLALTPRIIEMHRAGISRDGSPQGQVLEAVHRRAELFGKIGLVFGLGLIGLSVFTIKSGRPEDDDQEDEDAAAPLPPGPRDT